MPNPPFSSNSFQTFGELLKYLRRRERLTQLELSITVGYSEAQIGRLEKNQRRPDLTALKALFIPALHLADEPELMAHFLDLAKSAKQEDAPAPGFAPYKGLLFFDEADADLFFGREILTTHLTDRITDLATDASTRFLAIVGASGSGKSSLVRAGLVAALKSSGWYTYVFTPGTDPLKALEMQLDSNQAQAESDRVLILVDQFEETFTLCHAETERIAFIEKLLEITQDTSRKTIVVIALRADFYSHCAQYPLLRRAVAAEQEYIGQMTTEELRRAIEEPAKRGGWEFESGLVDVLLQDIGADGMGQPEPGALPLLSHALLETWERRRGKTFTLDGYRASGGVRSAIAETAESVFTDQLNQQQQELARDVFLRLTELGEGTEDTRRRAALNELVRHSAEATQLRTVLNTLAEARLITLNEDSAEVAHEALIREWQRLHEWLTQDREGLRLHRHLTESVREWETRDHDISELYRGARLAQAREWAETNVERLNELERAFLTASMEQEQHDVLEHEAQRQRELEAAQKLATTESQHAKQLQRRALFLTGAFVLAIVLAGVAFLFSQQATVSAKTAQAEQQVAFERELSASAVNNLSVDPERSILLALQAVDVSLKDDQPVLIEAQDALHRSIQTSRVLATLRGDSAGVYSVVASGDGQRLATLSDDGTLKIWDAASNQKLLSIPTGLTEQNVLRFISFSPDGKRVAAPAGVHLVKVWEVASGKELLTLSGHTDEVTAAIFSPDGTRIATGSWDTTAKLWDATTGKNLMTFTGHENGIATLAFSPDGNRLYTGSDADGVGIAWDVVSGKQLFTFDGEGGLDSIGVSPDGTRLATGEFDTTLKIWDAATGNKLLTFFGHASYLNGVVYSPNGKQLASTSEDGTTKLWDAETGKALLTLSGHISGVQNVAFSPDGNKLYTVSRDGTVKIWDVSPLAGSDLLNLAGHSNRVRSVAYRPDGKQLATLGYDGALKIWDAVSGKELLTITLTHMIDSMNSGGNALAGGVSYSPDSKRLAYNDLNTTKIVDATSGAEILSLPTDSAGNDVTFSPDGTQIAVGSADAGIGIYNSNNGKLLIQLQTGSGYNGRIVFSPDGRHIASANDGGANVWDATTGKNLVTFNGHGEGVALNGIAYSPDGKWIATSGNDATIKVWDSETGAEIFTLIGHTGPTFGVAFSPDGQYLATSSVDRTVKVWKLPKAGEQVPEPLTLYGNTGAVYQVAFSPDGTRVVSVGRDRIVRVYELNLENLIAIAKSRLTRSLTLEECQKYLHVEPCPAIP
jgi:WD40 repeat protein/transcriptional regulator with XRE-family HTH domain